MLTTIATFTEPWEAHLFAGRLRAEGLIPSIAFEQHVWNNWPIATALQGILVQVPRSQSEAAEQIFHDIREGAYTELIDEVVGPEPDNLKCPACGSRKVRSRHRARDILLSVTSLFMGGLMRTPPDGYRCKSCGARWGGEDHTA